MDRKAVSERLRALAADDSKRSKAARLRDVIDDVETALAAGVTRLNVLNELKMLGLDMSLATFETTLQRIRAKREQATAQAISQATLASVQVGALPAVTPPPASKTDVKGSHNPAELDQIMGSKPDLTALAKLAKWRK